MREYILSPSILAADCGILAHDILTVVQAGAQNVHLDVMDGRFVPCISFGMPVIRSLRPVTDAVFDVHLMIEEPERYVFEFADCGADIITVHAEATRHLDRVLTQIHSCGVKTGVALNPSTPLSVLEYVLDKTDRILLMTVNPGFGGQKYIEGMTEKIRTLRKILVQRGYENTDIAVDGGITQMNVRKVLEAGVNVIVAGSAIFDRKDAAGNVKAFQRLFEEYARKEAGKTEELRTDSGL